MQQPESEQPPEVPEEQPEEADASMSRFAFAREWGMRRYSEGRAQAEKTYDKYKDRPVVDVAVRIYHRDRDSAGTLVGSAVAFRLFLFFVPMLLFFTGLLGFVAEHIDREDLHNAGISGGLAAQIESALEQPTTTRWVATLLGLFGMAWAGRSLTKALVAASCLAWQLPVRTKASPKVMGAIAGLVAGIALVATFVNRLRDNGIAIAGMSFLVAFALYAVAWLILCTLLPRRANTDPSALVPGAVILAGVLIGMQAVSQIYLPGKFSHASEIYGAIGVTIVTLGWFFILGRVMMFSMSVDAVIYERFGSISQFVFSLPILRIIPRKSPKLRKLFGLEEGASSTSSP
ncbi:MAG TPA: YhjD/YihY/BrkB family envelope integrity protein [Acidimicrobiales bacterium]|nr:YhjD/YihY/BrkB family envelope integrity protein [Acidimicrobiales bacterium]